MAFHGAALVLREAALRDRQKAELLREKQRRLAPATVAVGARQEPLETPADFSWQDRRLVRRDDLLEEILDLPGASGRSGVERREVAGGDASALPCAALEERPPCSSLFRSERKSKRSRIFASPPSESFLALTRTCSGTEILPKSCRRAAVPISRSSSRENVTPAWGPSSAPSTRRASCTERVDTRLLWPAVVGSRCSTAKIAAWAKSSKSFRIDAVRWFAFRQTAACVASERRRGTRSSGYASYVPGARERLFMS
jgi:hypothetical protein